MNKYKVILFIIVLACYAFLSIQTMTTDIFKFGKGEGYTICSVRIEGVGCEGSDRHTRIAYFHYNQMKGSVICNFWEKEGDIIEVAYDENENFIRTGLCFSDHCVVEWMWCIIGVIGIIYYCVKQKDCST